MTVSRWLGDATDQLIKAGSDSARLDAEIILAHTIGRPRTYLHAHGDDTLELRHEDIANARLDMRLDSVPIAYIVGHKEFYGRRFFVTPATLIPRPESEQLIELLARCLPTNTTLLGDTPKRLVDIGTGSGCLGITAKLEYPELDVTLLDISRTALAVAAKNARAHDAAITTIKSNLLESYPYSPDIAIANLPYVDKNWRRSPETNHEPAVALFAADQGLHLIDRCFLQLSRCQKSGAFALFEADPRQWESITSIAKQCGFRLVEQREFAALFKRV